MRPASDRPEDVAAAHRADGHTNRWWLDPLHGLGFPADMREVYGVELPERAGDWEIDASGIETLLMHLTEEYGARELYVTENGSSYPDVVRADSTSDDTEHTRYLREHLAACVRATGCGAPLAGYFAWWTAAATTRT